MILGGGDDAVGIKEAKFRKNWKECCDDEEALRLPSNCHAMDMKERDRISGGEIGSNSCSVIESARRLFFELSRNRLQPSFGVKECSTSAGSWRCKKREIESLIWRKRGRKQSMEEKQAAITIYILWKEELGGCLIHHIFCGRKGFCLLGCRER
ncbi:U-box domain-containing protein 13-like [Pyrus ussuriensis x Pyrus communis]|uniref:U-box domain-containing protein 13-like n=1 Tax=Pyrus ussuriensis x Pyrus communis TaxID=2448454 RepID=A0A5N5GQ69_9ROSA|nr:U-box domain-containing protein 13-like [Pyrus ussuriensis x Pyrus communis]